jgi:hypothetical protein
MWVELFLATKSKHLSHSGSTDYANIEGMDIEQDNLCDAWWLTDIDEVCEAPWEQHQANTLYQDAHTRLQMSSLLTR